MPENELFKTIVNGGSFALLVLFFIWLLFKAEPNYRATVERMAEAHQRASESQCKTFEVALSNQLKSFEAIIANLQRDFSESLDQHEKQCRGERKEWIEAIRAEGELNRDSRHDLVNRLTSMYAEMFMQFKGGGSDKATGS